MTSSKTTPKNSLIVPVAIAAGAFAIVAPILYATNGSTLPDANKVANDWESSCRVDVDLKQSGRLSLDYSRYGKDVFNKTKFELPVACDQLEKLKSGTSIVDEFRWGSFITELGSSSSWDMSVKDTLEKPTNADETSCALELTLRERHAAFFSHVFIKDAWNTQSFDWQVPCDVHDKVEIGHNFVTDPWRKGSVAKRVVTNDTGYAAGVWSVEVTQKKGLSANLN